MSELARIGRGGLGLTAIACGLAVVACAHASTAQTSEQPKAPAVGGATVDPEKAPKAEPQPKADPETDPEPSPEGGGLRSLDDLLGLDDEAGAQAEPDMSGLMEALGGGGASEPLEAARTLMSRAAERMSKQRDAGVGTQRLQEEAIRRLEQVIEQAKRQQQQQQRQQQSASQQRQQQDQPNQRQSSQQQQNPQGDNTGQQGTVPGREGELGQIPESSVALWGNLPARVRESLSQGSSDTFSSVYRALTEAYYRRLAEEGGR